MAHYVTKEHFDARLDGFRSEIRQEIRDLVTEMRQGFRSIEEQFSTVNVRLGVLESKNDAIIQLLVTRRELHNLTRELRSQGVQIADHKVFEE